MCDEYELFEFLEMDAAFEHNRVKIERKRLRDQYNPFDMNDLQFIKKYRLTKDLVHNLCEELRPHMATPTKSTDLSIETKILVALSFFATGSYQRPTGDIGHHSISQSSVSKVIKQITMILNLPEIQAKYIKFPRTHQECQDNVTRFFNKFGVPGVLGCIDSSLIAILRPSENEEKYHCGKQYYALNVQLISNADMEIISVASYGGAHVHDSIIWANHPIKQHLEELTRNEHIWLLGDSGYPLRKYLMTPITNTTPGSPETHYTELHMKTRNVIKQTIVSLKARFRCLLVDRVLHYTPQVAACIVNACVVLHNMSVRSKIPAPALSEEDNLQEAIMQELASTHKTDNQQSTNNNDLNDGITVRHALISRLWDHHRNNTY